MDANMLEIIKNKVRCIYIAYMIPMSVSSIW